jgi:hypothetical protein
MDINTRHQSEAIDLYHANIAMQASHRGAPERVLTGKNKGFILLGLPQLIKVLTV